MKASYRICLAQILANVGYPALARLVSRNSQGFNALFALRIGGLSLGSVAVKSFLRRTKGGLVPVKRYVRRGLLRNHRLPRPLKASTSSFDSVLPSVQNLSKAGKPNAGSLDPFGNTLQPKAVQSRQQLVKSVQAKTERSLSSPEGGIEFAQLMNGTTGRQYKAFTGDNHSVKFKLGMFDKDVVVVHSHPDNVSLSLADLALSKADKRIKYAMAVDPSGNVYTGAATAKYSTEELSDLHFSVKDKIEDYLVAAMRNSKTKPNKEDYVFLMMHGTNLNLRNKGAVAYNAEINSPYYKQLLDGWSNQIDEMMNL